MRLKKLLALATASALAVTMLAACSSGSNTSAGTTSDSNAGTSTSTPAPSGDKVTLQLVLRTLCLSPSARPLRSGLSWWLRSPTVLWSWCSILTPSWVTSPS